MTDLHCIRRSVAFSHGIILVLMLLLLAGIACAQDCDSLVAMMRNPNPSIETKAKVIFPKAKITI